jgi:hypothetical protein
MIQQYSGLQPPTTTSTFSTDNKLILYKLIFNDSIICLTEEALSYLFKEPHPDQIEEPTTEFVKCIFWKHGQNLTKITSLNKKAFVKRDPLSKTTAEVVPNIFTRLFKKLYPRALSPSRFSMVGFLHTQPHSNCLELWLNKEHGLYLKSQQHTQTALSTHLAQGELRMQNL